MFGKLSLNVTSNTHSSAEVFYYYYYKWKINDSRGGCFTLLDLMVESACCKHEHMKPACFWRAAGAVGRWGWPWADRCPDSPLPHPRSCRLQHSSCPHTGLMTAGLRRTGKFSAFSPACCVSAGKAAGAIPAEEGGGKGDISVTELV